MSLTLCRKIANIFFVAAIARSSCAQVWCLICMLVKPPAVIDNAQKGAGQCECACCKLSHQD
jgi:hypothetical protein